MARKDPAQWSDSYRKRIESKFAKNPDISLAEARGHKPKAPAKEAKDSVKLAYNLREKAGNIRLRERLGKIEPDRAKEADKILKDMLKQAKQLDKIEGKVVGFSSLEWELKSQQIKEKEIILKAVTGDIDLREADTARSIINEMQVLTESMWDLVPPGGKVPASTAKYDSIQDRLRELYRQLEELGLVNRTGDITKGDIGYH